MADIIGSGRSDLHIRAWGLGPTPAWCREWANVFRTWAGFHSRYRDQTGNDLAWWYRERPNLSVVSAAIWARGGSALEEYRNDKWNGPAQYAGRADQWAVLGGFGYSIEAKHLYASLHGGLREDPVARAMQEAREDVARVDEDPEHRTAMTFVTPYFPVGRGGDAEQAVPKMRELLRKHRAADYPSVRSVMPKRGLRVDYFPSWARGTETLSESHSEPGKCYLRPGITVFVGFEKG